MAFVAVTSLMTTLELQFLHPQPRLTLSNIKQIESLYKKLRYLLYSLDDFEKNADNLPEMRAVIEEIIDVSVKAEDGIEEELLTASFSSTKLEETLQRVVDEGEKLVQIAKNLFDSNRRVGGSSSHVDEYSSELFNSNVDVVHEEEDAMVMVMVGHSEELNKVINQLLGETNRRNQPLGESERINTLQVIAVVGMGGIGKTTFAKRIYDDPRVKSHFELRAWTTMSPEHNTGQTILDLCHCVMPSSSAFNKEMQDDHLAAHLRQSLSGQRYLIIVDDIWTPTAWYDIHRCFPDDNNGSRILLTTRNTDVAYHASDGEYLYNMRFLNLDEGWNLFYQKFLDKELLQKDEFKTIGMNIVRKCQGLPLIVVVMAGLLSKTNKSIDEWGRFEKKLNSLLTLDLHEQFSRMFNLSYNQLPSHLKGCFLYLGVFHRDSEIQVKKLIRLWIAEGFVKTRRSRESLEEVGRDYLQDLIHRSLVMVNERSFDGKIKTCRMHNLLHELCTSKAKTENLVYLETTGSRHSFGHFVRLGYQPWLSLKVVNPDFHISISSKQWRSILCFNGCGREWYLQATSFRKLRVLDLSKIYFKSGMPLDITELVFLRYLALASSSSMLLKHIPLDKNWNLQTLIISEEGDDKDAHKLLPHGILDNLQQLRHLEINHKLQVSMDLLNLQTLYWLSISQCTAEVFMRIPNVKELGIVAGGDDKVSPQGLNYLEKLRVEGSEYSRFPQNLKELTFVSTRIPWSEMSIISMLPNLKVLKLKNFACTGQKWELIEDDGFPKLKVLIISLTDLKEWKANVNYPFPNLQRLQLKKCFELEEMPAWFEDITTLQLIKLVHCYTSLVHSANKIKAEQLENYQNELDVLDIHTRPDDDHVDDLRRRRF